MKKGPLRVPFDSSFQSKIRFYGHPYQTRWLDGSANFSRNKHLLSTYYVLGAVVGVDKAMNKAKKIHVPWSLHLVDDI